MKKYLLIVMSLLAVTSMVACSEKKDGGKTNRINRNSNFRNNPYVDRNNPNSQQGEWGVIYDNSQSMTSVLNSFMGGVEDLGFVSGQMNASTGVRFRGQVTNNQGSISILIWDDLANQGAEPIYWTMQVVSGNESASGARVIAEDEMGQVTFNGNFSGAEYRGTVSFKNEDGQSGTLGQFAIDRCALFDCY